MDKHITANCVLCSERAAVAGDKTGGPRPKIGAAYIYATQRVYCTHAYTYVYNIDALADRYTCACKYTQGSIEKEEEERWKMLIDKGAMKLDKGAPRFTCRSRRDVVVLAMYIDLISIHEQIVCSCTKN
uniref:Uncharacterized protein n=1 Tax=Trichogramma kaykai TaxID=54128 RepID=A0ABD2VW60_9HYME